MGVVLPGGLAWVLNLIGINWPNIDEDQLREAANTLRGIGTDLSGHGDEAKSEIEKMLQVNKGQSMDNFNALWQKVISGHLPQLKEGLDLLGTALDASAVVIEGMKVAAIVQLGILAAEIISDQAEAFFTFGASEALIPIQTEVTSQICKAALKQAVNAVEQQILQAVEGPIFSALDSAASNLAGQLLGDALGTHSGVDLGSVAGSTGSGFSKGVKQSEDQVTSGAENAVHDPASAAESVATGKGVPTA
jgi:uncharacterized protein YukE